jgi:RimJ/RimL family protein N-acetyltransferase
MVTLETERLRLRPWTLDDLDPLAAMFAHPEVTRFVVPGGQPLTRFAAWQALCSNVGHWHFRGFGQFAVEEKASRALVGRVGPWQPEGWPDFEIGWTLRREYWGRGFATEAALRCIEYAFTELRRPHLVSLIDPENAPSIRVAERVGERLEGHAALPHVPNHPLLQYGLSREEWARAK